MARLTVPKKKRKTVRQPRFVDEKYMGSEPEWNEADTWSGEKYYREQCRAMRYYNHFYTAKEMLPRVVDWMKNNGYTKTQLSFMKSTDDWRVGMMVGSLCAAMNKGMPSFHEGVADFVETLPGVKNSLRPAVDVIREKIDEVLLFAEVQHSKNSVTREEKKNVYRPSIQELTREKSYSMTEELEEFIDSFDNTATALRTFDPLAILHGVDTKSKHATIIRSLYIGSLEELEELVTSPKGLTGVKKELHDQLKEGYNHLTKPEQKALCDMYRKIIDACDMIVDEGKVARKPRKKKPVAKERLVSNVKYCESDAKTKLVSQKPITMVGAMLATVYNTKTRKFGIYIANDSSGFSFKGTTLQNFDEDVSIQKTLRKPLDQLRVLKNTTKRSLEKQLDEIKSVETKMVGRFNDQLLIVKVY